jgi:hypothetical protein
VLARVVSDENLRTVIHRNELRTIYRCRLSSIKKFELA